MRREPEHQHTKILVRMFGHYLRCNLTENLVLQNIHYFLQTVAIVTLIYLVAATEKTIDNNDVAKQADNWSYGQTIALILLLQQVMDVFSTFVDKMEDKEEEEEKAKQQRGDGGQQQVTSLPMDTLNP